MNQEKTYNQLLNEAAHRVFNSNLVEAYWHVGYMVAWVLVQWEFIAPTWADVVLIPNLGENAGFADGAMFLLLVMFWIRMVEIFTSAYACRLTRKLVEKEKEGSAR